MDHPYIAPNKFNEGKRAVKIRGSFLNLVKDGEGVAIDFKCKGIVIVPFSQVIKEISVDFETKDCSLRVPCWFAEDKGIDYNEVP